MLVLLAAVATGAMAQTTYTVTVKEGTEDASNWQGKAGEGEYQALPLEGVAAGTAVSVKYNGTKKVKSVTAVKKAAVLTYPIALSAVTVKHIGNIVTTDGNVYATAADAIAASETPAAMIAYVGSDTYDATYKNGLAIALADEAQSNWSTAVSTCEGKTAITGAKWCLPSQDQWKQMFKANGGNDASYTGLNTTITTAGGTTLQENAFYWSSSEFLGSAYHVYLSNGKWFMDNKEDLDNQVRACLAF